MLTSKKNDVYKKAIFYHKLLKVKYYVQKNQEQNDLETFRESN